MIERELQSHQWKAFKRHPMFEKNMGVKVFMFVMFGFIGLQMLAVGFALERILLEVGGYTYAIDGFNHFLLPLFLIDFTMKYMMKQNNSMQIAPYLTLPVKRNKLFNFLLVKEFSNVWNLYFFFLLLPFGFKAILPYFGLASTLLYLVFFYLICIGNSLLVNIANNLQRINGWFYPVPFLIVGGLFALTLTTGSAVGDFTVKMGEWILNKNPYVWVAQIAMLFLFWKLNQFFMRDDIYRELQGKKVKEATTLASFSFLDKLGEKGEFIQNEIKMIFRSKRLKQQSYSFLLFFVVYFIMFTNSPTNHTYFMQLFFTVFLVGYMGMIMSQYLFTSESSFFDGLMSRKHSLLNLLRAKYMLYTSVSVLTLLILMVLVFLGKLDFFFLISVFFYSIGFLYFLMFQNAVYNKSYFDLFDGGGMNWKGTSGNMLVVTLLGMFLPLLISALVEVIFNATIANYYMLTVGLIFTFTSKYWINWVYKRFLQRKYMNMEGFRSNA